MTRAILAALIVLAAFAGGQAWRGDVAAAMAANHAVRFAQHGAAPRPLPVADSPNQVVIDNFEFGPAEITVAPGTEVTWVNRDDEPHTVTSAADKPLFNSPALDTGEKFAFVFKQPGRYAYFCSIHPRMRGVIVVQ
jgi:plastocyanin